MIVTNRQPGGVDSSHTVIRDAADKGSAIRYGSQSIFID
ncbi:hypothetical protein SAMN05444271_11812 [Halohasta litchfieldiae]|jgi:hypothetical protein|uniref:Uncharacterized protein n=1 Tax=Halohasta litchfieldiae TaxID=1073996 RepID=A0A1H6VN08_9EURY|nr:hypothetical protein SAMN05444271_11812 [Halohasta litchfieldiae]